MNCYAKILALLKPGTDHQTVNGLIVGILELAAAFPPTGADSFSNPVVTAVGLLRSSGVNEHAIALIDSYLAPLSERWAKGLVR